MRAVPNGDCPICGKKLDFGYFACDMGLFLGIVTKKIFLVKLNMDLTWEMLYNVNCNDFTFQG